MTTNIMLAGVGGQGLVLMTNIICEAAVKNGYDVKSNDVVGLSQRGGMVWGSVKIGKKIYSPNIRIGEGDILLGMEPLEAYRWSPVLKDDGTIILNSKKMLPVLVQLENKDYPDREIEELKLKYNTIEINAFDEAVKIGNKHVSNVIIIGILAKYLDNNSDIQIKKDIWKEAIVTNVPSKAVDLNINAFELGYCYI